MKPVQRRADLDEDGTADGDHDQGLLAGQCLRVELVRRTRPEEGAHRIIKDMPCGIVHDGSLLLFTLSMSLLPPPMICIAYC